MGWDSTTQILTAPFTKIGANGQGDLQQALGRTTCKEHIQLIGDVDANGNPIGRVNKWAFYKPIKYALLVPLKDGERREAKCGLTVTKYTDPNTLRNNFSAQWAYDQPHTPSASTPLRASDFVQSDNNRQIITTGTRGGYNARASAPVTGWVIDFDGKTHYHGDGGFTATIGLLGPTQTPAYSVVLSDIMEGATSFGTFHLGVMLFYGDSLASSTYWGLKTFSFEGVARNIQWCQTNDMRFIDIAFSDSDLYIPSGASSRKYWFMPVISSVSAVSLDQGNTGSKFEGGIYACPDAIIASLIVKPAASANRLAFRVDSHDFSYSGGAVDISVGVTMWGTTGRYFAYITYELYDNDTGTGTAYASGTFYNDYVNTASSPTSYTFTNSRRMTRPDYVTIVLKDVNTQVELARITDIVTSDEP